MTRTLACRGASRRGSVQRRLRGTTAGTSADGHPPPPGQGRRLGARALRRRLLQAAQLDEPALQRDREGRRRRGRHVDRRQQGGRAAGHHHRGGHARQPARPRASTPGSPRTASRRTCRSCWPRRSRRSAPAGAWSDASSPRRSARSTCSCRDAEGASVAVEIKRRGDIDGVEQLTRYLELLNRDPLLAPVRGIFAAQEIKPQARVLALDRGIACVTVDYDALRGVDDPTTRLF